MSFTIYPAIDLKGGKCVRLLKGDMEKATIYADNPAVQAAEFAEAGAKWLHVVDLDGAFAGESANEAAVRSIISATSLPVQLGGGIRSIAHIEKWLNAGISRVILGTAAVKNPELVSEACQKFPGRIAVGIDARDGMVATDGWAETSDISAVQLATDFEDAGVAAIIFTDIGRDGTLQGVNIQATIAMAESVKVPIIASGGVAGMADIEALLAAKGSGIAGVICGRAIYDGRLNIVDAMRAAGA